MQKIRRQFFKTAGFGAAALALSDVRAQKQRPNARHVQRGVRTDRWKLILSRLKTW